MMYNNSHSRSLFSNCLHNAYKWFEHRRRMVGGREKTHCHSGGFMFMCLTAIACLLMATSCEKAESEFSSHRVRFLYDNSILFDAVDKTGYPIYHTNVMMSVGEKFAVVCEDVIISPPELKEIESNLSASGKKIIRITAEQMHLYAGNILDVRNINGDHLIVMSQTAEDCLTPEQLAALSECGEILPVHIPHIEEVGGGSARCMLAEVICC